MQNVFHNVLNHIIYTKNTSVCVSVCLCVSIRKISLLCTNYLFTGDVIPIRSGEGGNVDMGCIQI